MGAEGNESVQQTTGEANPIQAELAKAGQDLLDLSLRNSLLNYRPSKKRGLKIVDENPVEIFRILVTKRKEMSFESSDAYQEEPPEDDEDVPEELLQMIAEETAPEKEPAEHHLDLKLRTPYQPTQLELRLRDTFRDAHTSVEEQGVNILYLALGMLEWYEADESSDSRSAPLILIPVKLHRADIAAKYKLSLADDDFGPNLSLEAKLRDEFDILLPEFGDSDALDPERYFQEVGERIERQDRWKVKSDEIQLGFFSFSKFLLYKDLYSDQWPEGKTPGDNPIIQSLFGSDQHGEPPPPMSYAENLDQVPGVTELPQIMDADSSQTQAIVEAQKQKTLVIQGPPGTGKSQTIANLIGNAVSNNQTVLFMAEKIAALEVVKRRLTNAHVGDACLELHSDKANKKQFLKELKRTLELGRPELEDPEEHRAMLEADRDQLNEYCRVVNLPVGESGLSLHEIVGKLALTDSERFLDSQPLNMEGAAAWRLNDYTRNSGQIVQLQTILDRIGDPEKHLFRESGAATSPIDRPTIVGGLKALIKAWENMQRQLASYQKVISADEKFAGYHDIRRAVTAGSRVADAPDLSQWNHRTDQWSKHAERWRRLSEKAEKLRKIRAEFEDQLIPEAWSANLLSQRAALRSTGKKWWRFLSGKYRKAYHELRKYCRSDLPEDPSRQLALAEAIVDANILRQELSEALAAVAKSGSDWRLSPDEWKQLPQTLNWLTELHERKRAGEIDDSIHDLLEANLPLAKLKGHTESCLEALGQFDQAYAKLSELLEFDRTENGGHAPWLDRSPGVWRDWLDRAVAEIETLEDFVRFNQIKRRLEGQPFFELSLLLDHWRQGVSLPELFEFGYYNFLIRQAFVQYPALQKFDGEEHERIIARFSQLDRESVQHHQAQIAMAHWEQLPRGSQIGQMKVLRREFEKKTRHMSIRTLMGKAGQVIQKIKPVFMMSPLSVAKYLPPGQVEFDLIIFDEASQVQPIDSLGAIARADRAVVVGDSRQLPPTNFFNKMSSGNEEDDDSTELADLESLLGSFCASGSPQVMLRWHYRSRHESLIAVSNREFYENHLMLFPSPDKGKEEAGLHFHYLPDNHFEKQVNPGEAQAIARAVMEHAQDCPHLTLGVATFSLKQARRIEDELEILRREDRSREKFFTSHPEEPFFVKNLENVQGDERDVIIISVGYGRMPDGRVAMRFGPLNNDGGERRLNVLITRARSRCEVYANFTADELDMSRTKARGVEALKTYLQYSQTGNLEAQSSTSDKADSPFEEAVAKALRDKGYRIDHQIGSAGFFVDLGVVDPDRPGRYLLGIECDGATYHSAKWARDRDRLRQQILEGMGWIIHRIWSTDWFRHPKRELDKVETSIRRAMTPDASAPLPEPEPPSKKKPYERITLSKSAEENPSVPYQLATFDIVRFSGKDAHQADDDTFLNWVLKVVEQESPVHVNEATNRIATAAGSKRSGKRLRDRTREIAEQAHKTGRLVFQDDFLWKAAHHEEGILIRERGSGVPHSLRNPDLIAAAEIATALLKVIRDNYSIEPKEAINEASRMFGFKRVGDNIRLRFGDVLQQLDRQGTIRTVNGFFEPTPSET